MKWILGNELCEADQQYCLAAFVHRFTAQHKPRWANEPWKDGKPYPVQFASDRDWLEHTRFAVTENGRLDKRASHCMSTPTWPNNPELRNA